MLSSESFPHRLWGSGNKRKCKISRVSLSRLAPGAELFQVTLDSALLCPDSELSGTSPLPAWGTAGLWLPQVLWPLALHGWEGRRLPQVPRLGSWHSPVTPKLLAPKPGLVSKRLAHFFADLVPLGLPQSRGFLCNANAWRVSPESPGPGAHP